MLDSFLETLMTLRNFLLLYLGLLRETACQATSLSTWRWLPTFEEMWDHKGCSSLFSQVLPLLLCVKDGCAHILRAKGRWSDSESTISTKLRYKCYNRSIRQMDHACIGGQQEVRGRFLHYALGSDMPLTPRPWKWQLRKKKIRRKLRDWAYTPKAAVHSLNRTISKEIV